MTLPVEAEHLSDGKHNTEYSNFDMDLHYHQDSQVSMVSSYYYTYGPAPVSLKPVRWSLVSKVSHEDCSDTISPQTYHVHNNHIDPSLFILTKQQDVICLADMERPSKDIVTEDPLILEKQALCPITNINFSFTTTGVNNCGVEMSTQNDHVEWLWQKHNNWRENIWERTNRHSDMSWLASAKTINVLNVKKVIEKELSDSRCFFRNLGVFKEFGKDDQYRHDCGNISMKPSREINQLAILMLLFDILQWQQLQNNSQVLLRNTKRSLVLYLPIGGIDSTCNHETIRFLLWVNILISHFREIKVLQSWIFDVEDGMDCRARVCLFQKQDDTFDKKVLPSVDTKSGWDKRGGGGTNESIPVTTCVWEAADNSKQKAENITAEAEETVSLEMLAPCSDPAPDESKPREEMNTVEISPQNDQPFDFQLPLLGQDVELVLHETEKPGQEHIEDVGESRQEKAEIEKPVVKHIEDLGESRQETTEEIEKLIGEHEDVGESSREKTNRQANMELIQRAKGNAVKILNSKKASEKELLDSRCFIPTVGLFKDKKEFEEVVRYKGDKILWRAVAYLWDDLKSLRNLGKFPIEKAKEDFLEHVLNIPDCIQPPLQEVEVYNAFVERGYEAEWKRLASFDECPEENWYPAIPLAENGFHFKPRSSVICFFCKIESKTWQRDWNPKQRHEPHCPLPNGEECGNIPMKPSGDNGKYQPAVQAAFDELRISELQTKIQVLLRDSIRSLESFKNPQLPENQMGSLSINVPQGEGHQEHDAMEDEPQPSTSGSNSSQQQQEGAGGLRYFVHSYDERGNPISTSQKMEFNSNEEKANTSMKKETDRLRTFDNVWKKSDVISPKELAKSGFYYAGTGDRVRCAFCNGVLRNWAVGDRAAAEHRRHYPTCPFVLNLDVGNVPYSPDLSGLHTPTAATTKHTEQRRQTASTQRQQSAQSSGASFGAAITPSAVPGTILIPKHSNFTTVESRLLTYDNWPQSNVQRPKQLAEAGFFYTGSSDNVRCFHCDGGLRNWLDSDLPWVEHAKWFPRCGFLQRVKGVEFVLEETRKHNQQNSTTAVAQNRGSTGLTTTPASTPGVGIVERPATGGVRRVEAREVRARFDTDRVKMLLEMGYKEAVVKYVILQRLRYTGDDFSSIQEMLESVLAEQPNLEEKGIAYYENILQQEFGRPMTIVYPQVTQMTGTLDKTAVPSPAPPMTQTTSASLPIPGDEKSLVEENRQLKEQTTCKICMDNEVSMVFVPCGHLVACADCAPNLRQCPICRRAITGTIRTFLS